NEEERFHETLNDGMTILSTVIEKAKTASQPMVSGKDAFQLYDTYGFPFELTEELAEEAGGDVDEVGFEAEMEAQRERARAARQDVDSMSVQSAVLGNLHEESTFIGYEQLTTESTVNALVKDGELVDHAAEGDEIQFLLDVTPFYAESGGQIADKGSVAADAFIIDVVNVQKAPNGQNLHTGTVRTGEVTKGATGTATVDQTLRKRTIKNHTATHLLHKALKEVLGEHVAQAGSYVGPDRLRFDFSHFGQVTEEELKDIEQRVNDKIWADIQVDISEKP